MAPGTSRRSDSATNTNNVWAVRAPRVSREWSRMAPQQIPQGWGVKCRSPPLAGHQPSPIGGGRGTWGHLSLLRSLYWHPQQGPRWQVAHPSLPLSPSLQKRLFYGLKGGGNPAFSYLLLALLNSFLCLFLVVSGCHSPSKNEPVCRQILLPVAAPVFFCLLWTPLGLAALVRGWREIFTTCFWGWILGFRVTGMECWSICTPIRKFISISPRGPGVGQ